MLRVIEEENPLIVRTARYGLPAVVLIFYVTAATGMTYTPESTYLFLQAAAGHSSVEKLPLLHGSASPLWTVLVTAGSLLRVDTLLTVKVFSLLFSSAVVLCAFLVAAEVLHDRLIALCVSLSVALQAWLLQAAPSGSALPAALLLTLAGVFFLLRNDYLLAAFLTGLSTLIFWQAAALAVLLCIDVVMNSRDTRRAAKVAMMALVSFLCPVMVWIIIARVNNAPVLPVIVPFVELSAGDIVDIAAGVILVLLMVVGILRGQTANGDAMGALRSNFAAILWMMWLAMQAVIGRQDIALLGVPLVMIYGFSGLMAVVRALKRQRVSYAAACVLAGAVLVQNQVRMTAVTRPAMDTQSEDARQLITIAYWLRAQDTAGMTVEAEQPAIISFYSGKPVAAGSSLAPHADFIVTSARSVDGYEAAFAPQENGMDLSTGASFAVWRKK